MSVPQGHSRMCVIPIYHVNQKNTPKTKNIIFPKNSNCNFTMELNSCIGGFGWKTHRSTQRLA